MNTVTNAERSYYTANVNGKTEKGPCVAMTPYGVIGPERVKCSVCCYGTATMYIWNSQVIPQQQHMYTYSLSVLCAAMVHAATMYVWNSQVIPQQFNNICTLIH